MYKYKNLPSVTADQFELPPRERIIPMQKNLREPAVLTIEEGLRLQEERAKIFANRNSSSDSNNSSRAYNKRNEVRHNKSRDNSKSDQPSYYKSNADDTNQTSNNESIDSSSDNTDKPSSVKNPWAKSLGSKSS